MSDLKWLTDEERKRLDPRFGLDAQIEEAEWWAERLNAEREARELDARGYNAKLAVAEQKNERLREALGWIGRGNGTAGLVYVKKARNALARLGGDDG
jgi:hypothetical protein